MRIDLVISVLIAACKFSIVSGWVWLLVLLPTLPLKSEFSICLNCRFCLLLSPLYLLPFHFDHIIFFFLQSTNSSWDASLPLFIISSGLLHSKRWNCNMKYGYTSWYIGVIHESLREQSCIQILNEQQNNLLASYVEGKRQHTVNRKDGDGG